MSKAVQSPCDFRRNIVTSEIDEQNLNDCATLDLILGRLLQQMVIGA